MDRSKFDIFISYSRQDFDEVNTMVSRIKEAIPWINIWFDVTGVESGDEFLEKIVTAIDDSSIVLFAITDNSIKRSRWTQKEIMYAKNNSKRIIPALLKGSTLKGWFLFEFGTVDSIDIYNDLQWNKLIKNLSEWFPDQNTSNINRTQIYRETLATEEKYMRPCDMRQLGKKYHNGKNYIEAVKWYRKAAEHGDEYAQNELGMCYYNGQGIERNFTEAVKLFRSAVERGNILAQYGLGCCYEHGRGVEQDYNEAFICYRQAAHRGHSGAQFCLGKCYQKGIGVLKNPMLAVKWYCKAADENNVDALYELGHCYAEGDGVEQNKSTADKFYERAFKLYQDAANNGEANAQRALGHCYYYGNGVKENFVEAVKLVSMAANNGDAEAQYLLGDWIGHGYYHFEENESEAFKWFYKAAEQCHAKAQEVVGCYYASGGVVEKDPIEAVKWFCRSAQQGFVCAQLELGDCYARGEGVNQNYTEAVKWYRKAAEQESRYYRTYCASAQCALGLCYATGKGVKKNKLMAIKYLQQATKESFMARFCLELCYEYCVNKDRIKTIKWFNETEEQTGVNAEKQFGYSRFSGKGMVQSNVENIDWYQKKAEQGDTAAQTYLGCCYVIGYGVEQDLNKAVKLFRKAAEQCDATAQYNLGLCYEYDKGVACYNYTAAVNWYRKAAEQGNEYAIEKLKELGEKF